MDTAATSPAKDLIPSPVFEHTVPVDKKDVKSRPRSVLSIDEWMNGSKAALIANKMWSKFCSVSIGQQTTSTSRTTTAVRRRTTGGRHNSAAVPAAAAAAAPRNNLMLPESCLKYSSCTKGLSRRRISLSSSVSSTTAADAAVVVVGRSSRRDAARTATATRTRRPSRAFSNKSEGGASTASASASAVSSELELSAQLNAVIQEHGSVTGWTQGLSGAQREQLLHVLRGGGGGESAAAVSAVDTIVPEPTKKELRLVMTNMAIPFVGFGIMDNSILILAGDAIDTSLGVTLGISTMCAAAIGNIVSDVAGLMLGTVIEDFCANTLRLPVPNLTTAQRQLRSVRFASQWGCCVGVVVGCIIGMFPLMFIDSNKVQARKREAHLDSIFRDVVTEAGSLVGAARTCLYLLVSPDSDTTDGRRDKSASLMPVYNGKFLYNKYDDKAAATKATTDKERWIALGRGIVSRAVLTGESWNITDVSTEPDFVQDIGCVDPRAAALSPPTRSMLCVPVMDSSGRPIAVIQAINKVGKGREDESGGVSDGVVPSLSLETRSFTENDVQILKALASHISVSLQRMYEQADGEDAETRLKDTISMLRKYGLAGLDDEKQQRKSSRKKLARRPLFPED